MSAQAQSGARLRLSVVVPVRNEAGNIAPLIGELARACEPLSPFEIVYVDDGSSDATFDTLRVEAARLPCLRVVRHVRSGGQSLAVRTGVRHARAPVIATLDGDGQNDPAFIPLLVQALEQGGAGIGLAQGQRTSRKGGWKRVQSRIANGVRGAILNDGTRDTGCGLKVFRREVYLALPYFDALHRFMPALVKREGFGVVHRDVVDRPRLSGRSNYGTLDRLFVGLLDLAGVWWLIRRRKTPPEASEPTPPRPRGLRADRD